MIVLLALPACLFAQTAIVNYNFNSGGSYAALSPILATNVTSTATGSEAFTTFAGTAASTGQGAFTANSTAGQAIAMNNSSGSGKYFQFQLGGTALSNYGSYQIFLQAQRSGTGAQTITLQYSTNGSTWVNSGTGSPGNGSFSVIQFDLSTGTAATALDNKSTIYFRLVASGASSTGTLRIDNFQIGATAIVAPTVSTTAASTITAYAASSGGNVSNQGSAAINAKGVIWSTSSTAELTTSLTTKTTITGNATGNFTSSITNLQPNTTYYYRAYATNTDGGTGYGTKLSFTTQAIPSVTTTASSNVTSSAATAGGNVTSQGTSAVTQRGVVWSTSQNPTITTNSGITNDGNGTGIFISEITGLALSTTYYYRAYATNDQGTAYGAQSSFQTLSIVAPIVITGAFNPENDAAPTTAVLNGSVSNDGGAAITQRGFVWNTTGTNLTVGQNTTVTNTGGTNEAFQDAISGLSPNAQYFYRAYASNGTANPGYGATNNFYTHANIPGVPTIGSPTLNSLNVTADTNGNPAGTQYVVRIVVGGVTWYLNSNGTLQDTESWLNGTTLVNRTVSGLNPGSTYTFDVKARNTTGIETAWSATAAGQTNAPTTPFFNLTASNLEFGEVCINANGQGFFTFETNNLQNGQQIAVYALDGFSYSLTENGTYSTGLFIPYTNQTSITVYVRFTPTEVKDYPAPVNGAPGTIDINTANASTLKIPVYGEGINTPGSATTGVASAITVTGVTLAGQTAAGCPAITERGIAYSTTQGFTTGTQVAGTGNDFTVTVSGLQACTQYYYKAYVVDGTGTHYGEELSFTTSPLTTPVASQATNIAQTAFTANWGAAEGAAGYYLEVSDTPDFTGEPVVIDGVFDSFTANTNTSDTNTWTGGGVNWTAYKSRRYTSALSTTSTKLILLYGAGQSGEAGPEHTAGYIISDVITGSLNNVSFETRAINANTHSITVVAMTGEDFSQENFIGSRTFASNSTTAEILNFTTNITGPYKLKIYISNIINSGYVVVGALKLQGAETTPAINVSGTSYNVADLLSNTAYYYRVRAYGGTCSSAYSNIINVTTLSYLHLEASELTFGDVCTNTTATGSFTLTGSSLTNATVNIAALNGYAYSLTENGIFTPTLSLNNYNGAQKTVYVQFDPAAVQAYNGNIIVTGEAPYAAAQLEIPVTGSGIYTPAQATAAAATNITMVSATLPGTSTAGNCSPTLSYGIEYSTVNNFPEGTGTQLAPDNIENGTYTVSPDNLNPCTTYYYKAYTENAEGFVYSAQRSFTTTAISAPVAFSATNADENSFTANWDAVENAAGYRLDVSTNPDFETFSAGQTTNETFESIPANNTSYLTRSWTGTDGIAWNATDASTNQSITARAITLRVGSLTNTTPISGGLSSISFDYQRAFTTGTPTLTLYINGQSRGVVNPNATVQTFTLDNLNIAGDIEIELRNTGGSSHRTIIDNLQFKRLDVAQGYYLPGYENLDVANVTSLPVSGLGEFGTYYYRVRAYAANCATVNSNTITVRTKGTVTWKIEGGQAKWTPAFYADGTTPVIVDNTIPVRIETAYNTNTNGIFTAKSLTLATGTFTVATGTSLTIENEIVNNLAAANFIVENNANLIQNNEQASLNADAITVYRDSSPLYRQDYTLWASPVTGQNLLGFSPNTLASRFYIYDSAADQYDDIAGGAANNSFTPGQGYMVRMPNGGVDANGNPTGTTTSPAAYQQGTATMVYNGKFTGVPNNGTIPVTLSSAGTGINLVGNPYPSAINITDFLSANQDVIDGTVYVWRKTNASTNTAYCTINTAGQYIDNDAPNTEANPNSIIRTGQGFLVQLNAAPAGTVITFNNTMRSDDTANQFFRNANQNRPEAHGIYLNITNANGFFSQMYTGYVEGATAGVDNGIDSKYINDKSTVLSTVLDGTEYVIHGRALPFNTSNMEPLQLRVAAAGSYTIAIGRLEGLFAQGQQIFIKDKLAGVTHNLTDGAYTFTTEPGTFASRFEIVYVADGNLGTDKPSLTADTTIVYKQGSDIVINTGTADMKSVAIFDTRGRMLYNTNNVNGTEHIATGLQAAQQVLIVQVTTLDNQKVSKKIIF